MKPETTGLALLLTAEQTLAGEIAPNLNGDMRYKTLMAASAIRMVIRELDGQVKTGTAADPLDDVAALSVAIRRGERREDSALHRALLVDAEARTRVSNPAFHGLPPSTDDESR